MRVTHEFREPRPGEIESYLASHGATVKRVVQKSGEQLRFTPCPSCGGKSDSRDKDWPSYVNPNTGAWNCNKCGLVGGWYHLTKQFGYPIEDPYKGTKQVLDYHSEWGLHFAGMTRTPVTSNKYPDLLEYCNKRGISNATLDEYRVSSKGNKICQWPIYAWKAGAWAMVNSRCVQVEDKKNWFGMSGGPTHLLIGVHTLDVEDKSKRAWIFEGQWDAMSGYEIGLRNCFSLPNGTGSGDIPNLLKYIPEDWEIMLCVDDDEAGNKYAEKWFYSVGIERLKRVKLPYKDLNEWLQVNPELKASDVTDLCEVRKRKLTMDSFKKVKKVEGGLDSVAQLIAESILVDTPYPGLTEKLGGGFFKGYITTFLAPEKAGKTTIINNIAYHVASQKVYAGVLSLEDTQAMQDIRHTQALEGYGKQSDTVDKYVAINRMSGGKTTHDEVIEMVSDMLEAGFKFIVVDNLDFISDGRGLDKGPTFRKLVAMVSATDAHLVLVSQPRKVGVDKWVTRDMLKGLGTVSQDTSNFITLNRHPVDEEVRVLTLEVSRQPGAKHGQKAAVNLRYDAKYNLYNETVGSVKKTSHLKVISLPDAE